MTKFECSVETPWGIHLAVRNDESCARCGWTAPGPKGDTRAEAQSMGMGAVLVFQAAGAVPEPRAA